MDDLVNRYLATLEMIAEGKRWFQTSTPLQFAALHLTVAQAHATGEELQSFAGDLRSAVDRVDPLRAYSIPMAGLAIASGFDAQSAIIALREAIESFQAAGRPLSRSHRARAVPALVFLDAGRSGGDAPDRLRQIHAAWNARHRWMTTGRHYSFAAIAVAAHLEPEAVASSAETAHDILADAGYWHEWDASILLSFHPEGPEAATDRYERAAEGFLTGRQKLPPVARDDVAVVALGEGDPRRAGTKLIEYNQMLLELRPQPPRQVAMALAAALVLAGDSEPDTWQRLVVDGFALYAYAEALTEQASD